MEELRRMLIKIFTRERRNLLFGSILNIFTLLLGGFWGSKIAIHEFEQRSRIESYSKIYTAIIKAQKYLQIYLLSSDIGVYTLNIYAPNMPTFLTSSSRGTGKYYYTLSDKDIQGLVQKGRVTPYSSDLFEDEYKLNLSALLYSLKDIEESILDDQTLLYRKDPSIYRAVYGFVLDLKRLIELVELVNRDHNDGGLKDKSFLLEQQKQYYKEAEALAIQLNVRLRDLEIKTAKIFGD